MGSVRLGRLEVRALRRCRRRMPGPSENILVVGISPPSPRCLAMSSWSRHLDLSGHCVQESARNAGHSPSLSTSSIHADPVTATMPIALLPKRPENGITRLTNCRLIRGNDLVNEDLWVSSQTGKIISSQAAFFDELTLPDSSIDLGGRIVSPGLIDVQLNGGFGFNFSTLLEDTAQYGKKVLGVNKKLVTTGVTSYVPTLTSQRPELYQKVRRSP